MNKSLPMLVGMDRLRGGSACGGMLQLDSVLVVELERGILRVLYEKAIADHCVFDLGRSMFRSMPLPRQTRDYPSLGA